VHSKRSEIKLDQVRDQQSSHSTRLSGLTHKVRKLWDRLEDYMLWPLLDTEECRQNFSLQCHTILSKNSMPLNYHQQNTKNNATTTRGSAVSLTADQIMK